VPTLKKRFPDFFSSVEAMDVDWQSSFDSIAHQNTNVHTHITTSTDSSGNSYSSTNHYDANWSVTESAYTDSAGNTSNTQYQTSTDTDGNDVFMFNTATANNVDTILDFVTGTDKIQLSKSVFTSLGATGSLSANLFSSAKTANDSDDRISYNSTTDALYYDADGSGSGAAVQIAILGTNSHPSLQYSDIQIIA